MSYEIFLVETLSNGQSNYTKLDTEDLDMSILFSVSDISDLSKRNDTITKTVKFKGTKTNNYAFGNIGHLNRVSLYNLGNRIFFNTSPLRPADCLVYEDSILIMQGSIRIIEVNSDSKGDVIYDTTITGKFIDFKTAINDLLLTDIDFTNLQHHFTTSNIASSWNSTIEKYNPDTNSYYRTPSFVFGSGYVYPFIDYGERLKDKTSDEYKDPNKWHVSNFRPAVYVKEYFDRIFSTTSYTYEIKGSPEFLDRWNRLIVPNADEKQTVKVKNVQEIVSSSTPGYNPYSTNGAGMYMPYNLQFNNTNFVKLNDKQTTYSGHPDNDMMIVNKTFTSDALVNFTLGQIQNVFNSETRCAVQVVERDYINLSSDADGFKSILNWNVCGEYSFTLAANESKPTQNITFIIGERTYEKNRQLMLRFYYENSNIHINTLPLPMSLDGYTLNYQVSFPKDATTLVSYNIELGDVIKPTAPINIKQFDFIKSIISLFNFYVYSYKDNPRHLIFERYDDFYSLASLQYLAPNALNWTNKIDYSKGWTKKSMLDLAKKYTFIYKSDSDYVNTQYQNKYVDPYGTFRFTDSLGITTEKKVELIFSPSPMIQWAGSGKVHAGIYKSSIDNPTYSDFQPTKSNIRILYYNYVKNCPVWSIVNDKFDQGTYSVNTEVAFLSNYGNASNYYYYLPDLSKLTPVDDLNFNRPNETYFLFTSDYANVPTAYANYYINQTTELKNENIFTIECQVLLNEIDINSLDLKTPVFVDMGEFGNAYFKVIEVDYQHNNTPSTVVLQKISI